MNISKISIALVVILTTSSFEQPTKSGTYTAYLNGSMQLWERSIKGAQDQFAATASAADQFELALAMYGGLSATMRDQDEDFFDRHVDEAMEHLEDLIEKDHRVADCKAIMSGIYGFKIAYSPWKGMYLGPKSSNTIESALKLNPESPIVQKLYANNMYFTPETWGGDLQKAIKAYEKAIELFERTPESAEDWIRLDTYAWLGQAYVKAGEKEKAKKTYLASLELEKDFNWVSFVLLPKVAQ